MVTLNGEEGERAANEQSSVFFPSDLWEKAWLTSQFLEVAQYKRMITMEND